LVYALDSKSSVRQGHVGSSPTSGTTLNMKLLISGLMLSVLFTVFFAGAQPQTVEATATQPLENRCGWFSNPTPANASLYDRDAEWIIGVQGGYQAEGDWPDFGPGQWVKTNVNYGYGCACLKVRVDGEKQQIIKIESARALPLSVCRRDRSLKRWGFK
jgi:Protein of unknown function (DUF4087)